MLWNQKARAENCPLHADALWVKYKGGVACIRFFSAGNLQYAPLVMVIFRGDRVPFIKRNPGTIPANTPTAQRRQAARLSAQAGMPVVIMARPGTYGSSGNHYQRRQPAEFLALNAAMDSLRARYHIKKFILNGHSGGATAASALLTFGRRDIRCAILTSGAWDLLNRAEALRKERREKSDVGKDVTGLRQPYDPLYHIEGITQDPQRLVMVVGNLLDKTTPFNLQLKFAHALRENKHRVLLIEWPAYPPEFHNLKGSPGIKYVDKCKTARLAKRRT
ncbi:alpha/beta hydrolase family protein [Vagococcus sp. WN89Y]|uniref:alpha/beta hydrolase family protein n=1 Tax=Vagococcus sp. WN89Y TaxID=3457258 RepID=UPI003FCCB4D8